MTKRPGSLFFSETVRGSRNRRDKDLADGFRARGTKTDFVAPIGGADKEIVGCHIWRELIASRLTSADRF